MTQTILCLCSGNYCRSPMAEGLLRREIARNGHAGQIVVQSAGTTSHYDGEPPAPLVVQVVIERGGDLDGHRPHQVTGSEIAQADLILAMAQEHVDYIAAHFPEAAGRTMLLSQLIGQRADVPDPGVQELVALNWCADIIERDITQGYAEILRRAFNNEITTCPSDSGR
jgi:protein-tyrosine-phosphatase